MIQGIVAPGRALILAALSAILLVSCGGGGSGGSSPGGDPQPEVEGVLLEGQASALALSAIVDMFPIPADPADIEDDLLLSRLDVAIAADATVGEVNAALEAIDARIVGMRAGLPVLAIGVPRQADEAALQALADQLMAKTGIRIAVVARQPVAMLAPPSPADAAEALRHLQAAGFPAAWNVKSLAGDCSQRPTVVVADWFVRPVPGNSPYADFGLEVPGVDDNGIGGGGTFPDAGYHGYNVLTTLAAALDDEVPTGANPFPDCLDIRTVQHEGLSGEALLTAIGASLPATGKVVVNASFGYDGCPGSCTVSSINAAHALHRGLEGAWARAILQPLSDRVLVTAAAGNEADTDLPTIYAGVGIAEHGSALNVAAKADPDMAFAADESLWEPLRRDCSGAECVSFPSLTATPEQRTRLDGHLADLGLPGRTPAANVLVVGSTAPITQRRSSFSNPGHDVAAIGEGVPIMDKNVDQSFKTKQGTSYAAPQVAALAAYLWMISPQLRDGPLADTISAITGNTTGEDDQIDAYASVLSLDPAGEPDSATWRIRVALLDVDGSGAFDQDDLTAFLAAYQAPGAGQDKDHSRHDLNGDGFTGKEYVGAPFDLERTGSVRYGAPLLTTERLSIYGAGREIDERFASDKDILCYYAYSAIYTGDTAARDAALRDWCAEITVEVTPAQASVSPGGTVNFAADVFGAADPRVTWELPDGGGSISADGVFTAGDSGGTFTVRAISVEDVNAFGDATVTVNAVSTAGRVVFERNNDLWVLVPGSTPTNITPGTSSIETEPEISPDGTRIVFQRGGAVAFINTDSTGLSVTGHSCLFPSWAGNGQSVVCYDINAAPDRIRRLGADGGFLGNIEMPTGLTLVYGGVGLSPDGERLVFSAREVGGAANVYTMNLDGTGLINVTNNPPPDPETRAVTSCGHPNWSPDGGQIVVVCGDGDFSSGHIRDRLQIFPASGGVGRTLLLVDDPMFLQDPDWSPDGTALVFTWLDDGEESSAKIYRIDAAAGADNVAITNGPEDGSPSWGQ
jgi:hypothetical protein